MSAVVLVILLLGVITSTASPGFRVVGPDGPVVGVVGEDLVLPCFLKPNTSAVDMDVVWLIGGDIVHHYRREQSYVEKQLPAYWGRTSLSREDLARGNISLKLRSVRLSDENTYRCYIASQTGTDEAPVHVRVEAVGSTPVISAESLSDGQVTLQCESEGWSTEPRVDWVDSRGRSLPAEATSVQAMAGHLRVSKRVTVQESDGSSFLCRVSSQRQAKLQEVEVPRHLFAYSRHHWAFLGSILLFLLLCVLGCTCYTDIWLYKRWVISNFTWAHDYSHLPGKHIKTYTEPLIICRHKGTDRGQDYKEITLDHLFSPDEDEPCPKVVIVQGRSGFGKSITTRKIICDWASGTRYTKEFDLVVLLKCKELIMQGERRSLLELVGCPQRIRPVMEAILKNAPHKALFIIDGFDELKMSAAVPSSHLPSQPSTRAPPADTIQALLGGHILPESFLLVTTRHTAADRLREVRKHREQRSIEILGFNKDMVKEYFNKFPSESHSKVQMYESVRGNSFLLSSCSNPVRCWMMCSVLKETRQKTLVELETRTSLYVLFVSIFLKNTNIDKIEALRKLAKMAKNITWGRVFLLDEENVSGLEKIPLLCRTLQRGHTRQRVVYRFVEQTVQEFFAALYFITLPKSKMQDELTNLLDSVRGPSTAKNIHLLSVIRFLFGFSSGTEVSALGLPTDNISLMQKPLEKWILEEFGNVLKDVRLFHCCYELHNVELVRRFMESCKWVDLAPVALQLIDCWVLRYCLQCSPYLEGLNLSDCNLTVDMLQLLAPALNKLSCNELWLGVEQPSNADKADDVGDVVSALGTERTLRKLRVENSQLSDESVQQILNALRNQESVGSVHLSVKTVSLDMANRLIEHVCSVTVTGIMSISLTGRMLHDQNGDYLCSSLSVGKDQHSFTVSVGHDASIFQPAALELSVTLPSCEDMKHMEHWTDLHKTFLQLKEMKNKPALDENVEKLLCSLRSLPGLQKVYLKASIQTIQWASQTVSLISHPANLKEINVETLCSFLSVRRNQHSTLRLTVGSQTPPALSLSPRKNRLSPLSLVSLTFLDDEVPPGRWNGFLKSFNTLSRNTKNEEETSSASKCDVDALDSLFSFLLSVPGLREVELRVGSLTHTWAKHVLTFIRDKEITVNVLKEWGSLEDGLCSSLYVTKTTNNFRLAVEHLSQGNSTPALSYISILINSPTDRQLNWIDHIRRFRTLKPEIESVSVYEYVRRLLSPLRLQPGLREVELRVSCLTDSLVQLIIPLIQDCPTLQEVRLSAGRFVVSESLSVSPECGPLLLENIKHLKESLKEYPDCTITLIGIKRRTVVSSHFREGRLQHNRPVKITIKGHQYTEEFLEH